MSRQAELTSNAARLSVVAGILSANGRILISDRAQAHTMRDFWEFPGGKVRSGESSGAALGRELYEELGITGLMYEHFRTIRHDYPDLAVEIEFFTVTSWHGKPQGREGQSLRWVVQSELDGARILPADAAIVAALCPVSKC